MRPGTQFSREPHLLATFHILTYLRLLASEDVRGWRGRSPPLVRGNLGPNTSFIRVLNAMYTTSRLWHYMCCGAPPPRRALGMGTAATWCQLRVWAWAGGALPATRWPRDHVMAILFSPPPSQRYFTGVVAEGVSGELRYHVQHGVSRGVCVCGGGGGG